VKERLKAIEAQALSEIDAAATKQALEEIGLRYLSRKGVLSRLYKELLSIDKKNRPAIGQEINRLKLVFEQDIKQRMRELYGRTGPARGETFDVTMPGILPDIGKRHPITKTIDEICRVFSHMGFAMIEGPEIETEFNNFEALNIPLEHPSRDTFDTFYLDTDDFKTDPQKRRLLRSHTSPVQIRYMQKHRPPFSIIAPGKVFRPDATDASHSFMFHQIEGLVVGDNINFANLKWVLFEFARQYFGESTKVRFRPHFFPFTEPSAEVDVSCIICAGQGCRVCAQSGWLEILGAGMVDPNVFHKVNIDADRYSGFAFGMGIERIAMLRHGIDDIRFFYDNDLRFLNQF
jgi:phenylalanyl-tRNA synthetase alpha chain